MNKHAAPKLVVALLLVVAVVVGLRAWRHRDVDETVVRGSGTIEATEIDLASEVAGRLIEVKVDEGDEVGAGQVIALVDPELFADELRRAEGVAETARMRLADLETGTRPEEVRARAAQLREALAGLTAAQRTERLARAAYERPTELSAAVDAARTNVATSAARTRQARAQQQEARTGPRPEDIAEARAARDAAGEAVAAAEAGRAQAASALRGRRAELAETERAAAERRAADTQHSAARARLAAAEASLAAAQARRDLVTGKARPDLREQLVKRVERQEVSLKLAEQQIERDRQLFEAGAISRKQYEASQAARDGAVKGLEEARAALADLDAGARPAERGEAEAQVARATAELRGAREAVDNARREDAVLDATTQQQLARAQAAVAQAEDAAAQAAATVAQTARLRDQAAARLAKLEAGTRSEQVEQAAAQVQQAAAAQGGASTALRHSRQAAADRFALRQQLVAAEGQVAAATARVEAARAQLDLAVAGPKKEQIGAARGDLQQAEAASDAAATRYADTAVRAPRGGTVSEIVLREGETVSPGSTVVRLLDLRHLWLRVYLPVRQFGRIRMGQTARVRADAYPDKVYPGRVIAVSDEAEFTPKNTQTTEERVKQVFWLKVEVADESGELKPGLPADVELDVAPS